MPHNHVGGHPSVLIVVVFHKVFVRHALLLLDQDSAFDHFPKARSVRVSSGQAWVGLHAENVLGDSKIWHGAST